MNTKQPILEIPVASPSNITTKPTPTTLGWAQNTDLPKLYKFVVKNGEPRFELLPCWTVTGQTPQTVFLDSLSSHNYSFNSPSQRRYPCTFPNGCNQVYSRVADLDRHYQNVHSSEKTGFTCDYQRCLRAQENSTFTRKDHYRDHLCDYHKEDCAPSRSYKNKVKLGREKNTEDRFNNRCIDPNWWRCTKCLHKVYIKNDGWECPTCEVSCEPERIARRQTLNSVETQPKGAGKADVYTYEDCVISNNTGWTDDFKGGWLPCPKDHSNTFEYTPPLDYSSYHPPYDSYASIPSYIVGY